MWDDFPRSKATSTGYDYKCKECHREAWHLRKPPAIISLYSFPPGFALDAVTIREIMTMGEDGRLQWAVDLPKTRKGHIVGEKAEGRQPRAFINGVRYRVSDLVALWHTGEIPSRVKPDPRNVVFEAEWMKEIRSNRAFPDWSVVWNREKARRVGKARWHAMTPDQRKAKEQNRDKEKKRLVARNWKTNNRERHRIQCLQWIKDNPEKVKISRRKELLKPKNKAKRNLRSRFKDLMKNVREGGSSSFSSTIGCTTSQLAKHLESKFKRGMTWENYGTHWHVDHILPCASFDHADPKQVKQCWHWTNLEPLEAKKNLYKSDSITKPQMQLCLSH